VAVRRISLKIFQIPSLFANDGVADEFRDLLLGCKKDSSEDDDEAEKDFSGGLFAA
jgi:hypothetical protein